MEMTGASKRALTSEGEPRTSSNFPEPGASAQSGGGGGGGSNCGHPPGAAGSLMPRCVGCPEEAKPAKQAAPPNMNVRRANTIDKYSRIVFPAVFTGFSIAYWVSYIHISHLQMMANDFIMN